MNALPCNERAVRLVPRLVTNAVTQSTRTVFTVDQNKSGLTPALDAGGFIHFILSSQARTLVRCMTSWYSRDPRLPCINTEHHYLLQQQQQRRRAASSLLRQQRAAHRLHHFVLFAGPYVDILGQVAVVLADQVRVGVRRHTGTHKKRMDCHRWGALGFLR